MVRSGYVQFNNQFKFYFIRWILIGVTPESIVYGEGCRFLDEMMQKVLVGAGKTLDHNQRK